MVQEDLSMTQKDKFMLQAKVSELKNNMKTLLQQNQQLKLDLRRSTAKMVTEPTLALFGREVGRFPRLSDTKLYLTNIEQLLCGNK